MIVDSDFVKGKVPKAWIVDGFVNVALRIESASCICYPHIKTGISQKIS